MWESQAPVGVMAHEGRVAMEGHGGLPVQVNVGQLPCNRSQASQQQMDVPLRRCAILLQQRNCIQPCISIAFSVAAGYFGLDESICRWDHHAP